MAGFTTRDDVLSELTVAGKVDEWWFAVPAPGAGVLPEASGFWTSLWKIPGIPGPGVDPATTPGTVYDSDAGAVVPGSMWFPDRSTDTRWLLSFGAASSSGGTLMLYDRLAGVSGVAFNGVGSKTVNSGALTRYSGTDAIENQVWLEYTTAGTANTGVYNLNSYTTADGTTGQSGGSVSARSATPNVGMMLPLPLHASLKGVRSVEAGLNVGTSATTAVGNVLIIRPLVFLPMTTNSVWNDVNFLDDVGAMPRIYDNATLGLAYFSNDGTTSPNIHGRLMCVYG